MILAKIEIVRFLSLEVKKSESSLKANSKRAFFSLFLSYLAFLTFPADQKTLRNGGKCSLDNLTAMAK